MKQLTGVNYGCSDEVGPVLSHWFTYPIRVQPHHTDYGGIVWHGTYITWLESARVEALASVGLKFADLVALGVDLPVVDLSLKYHRSLRLGDAAVVRSRLLPKKGVRLVWDYRIESPASLGTSEAPEAPEAPKASEERQCYITGQVSLVALDPKQGKVLRCYPPALTQALKDLSTQP